MATQLNRGVDHTEVKITSNLSDLKPLHASWIVDLYEHLEKQTRMIIKDFVGISEAANYAQFAYEKIESIFRSPQTSFFNKEKKIVVYLVGTLTSFHFNVFLKKV